MGLASTKNILIRADAGGRQGIGHVMRMIALAQAWQDQGGHAVFASALCPAGIQQNILKENFDFKNLNIKEPGSYLDIQATLCLAKKINCTWIILDGYHFNESYQKAIKDKNYSLVCVDDYGHSDFWHTDILLNQNLFAPFKKNHYLKQATDNCIFLLGPKYALLRRQFDIDRSSSLDTRSPKKLLITFGGVDEHNWTEKILKTIINCDIEIDTTIVVGAGYQHLNDLKSHSSQSNKIIRVIQNAQDMAKLYRHTDYIISAAGSSSYEWLRYQIPALVFITATNQEPLAPFLNDISGVIVFKKKASTQNLQASIKKLVHTTRNNALNIIDASGSKRVVSEMLRINSYI